MALISHSPGKKNYRIIVRPLGPHDPRSAGYLRDAHALGLTGVTGLACQDLYFVQGDLTPAELDRMVDRLLHDPVTQEACWEALGEPQMAERSHWANPDAFLLEVALRPGVTDPVAEQIVRAAHLLGIAGVQAASTGLRFLVYGESLQPADLHRLANRLLCNPVIQRYTPGEIAPAFPELAESTGQVDTLPVRGLSDAALLELSQARRAALDLAEMQAIRAYCETEGRDLTDIEFEMLAQTWSEHCVHKTFKARITLQNEGGTIPGDGIAVIDNLFNQTIRAATRQVNAPWVRSAFSDNAGIIEFDGENEISFKVETHNHPSAIPLK